MWRPRDCYSLGIQCLEVMRHFHLPRRAHFVSVLVRNDGCLVCGLLLANATEVKLKVLLSLVIYHTVDGHIFRNLPV